METHTYFDGSVTTVPCLKSRFGRCRYCELIDIHGPHYRQDYHRMFRPEEFAGEDAEQERAKIRAEAEAEIEASGAAVVHPDLMPDLSPAPSPSLMLAGDLVAELTSYLGVDRATKWLSKQLGVDCGCSQRQARLNAVHLKASRLLKRLAGRRPA